MVMFVCFLFNWFLYALGNIFKKRTIILITFKIQQLLKCKKQQTISGLTYFEHFQDTSVGCFHAGHVEVLSVAFLQRVGHLGIAAHVLIGGRHGGDGSTNWVILRHGCLVDALCKAGGVVVYIININRHCCAGCLIKARVKWF